MPRTHPLCTGILALCATALLAAPTTSDAQGDVVVVPGDVGGVLGPPSVDLGVVHPGRVDPGRPPPTGEWHPTGSATVPPVPAETPRAALAPTLPPMCPILMCDIGQQGHGNPPVPLGNHDGVWCLPPQNQRVCPTPSPSPSASAPPPPPAPPAAPSPDVLAQQAYSRMVLPLPTPQHSPDLRLPDGRAATVVGEHTWFWTDPARWQPVRQRVDAGPVWAAATATPVELTLDPGDGQPRVSCPGPGTPYDRRYGQHAGSPSGCDVVYDRASTEQPQQQVTATWSITWRVTWTGNTGTAPVGGVLPELTSRASATYTVAEVQALRTH
jgi:hypothetical protein